MRPLESFIAQPVRSLQTMLRVIAKDAGYDLSVIPDGIYGRNTMSAVADFQRSSGLPVTGVTNQATWEQIVEAYTPARTRQVSAQPVEIILDPGQVIRRNESHPQVLIAQSMLFILSRVYGSVSPPQLSGTIDIPTAESLESFQALNLLPITGELDKVTWKYLALHYPLASNLYLTRRI